MVHESERRGRIEEPAAGQFHHVTGILRMVVEDGAEHLSEHDVGRDPAAGEDALADVGFRDPEETFEAGATGLAGLGVVMGHRRA